MSEVNYKEAWGQLKDFINKLAGTSLRFAEHEAKDGTEACCAIGGALFSEQILLKMEHIEEKMTTVGEDDDQQAQD